MKTDRKQKVRTLIIAQINDCKQINYNSRGPAVLVYLFAIIYGFRHVCSVVCIINGYLASHQLRDIIRFGKLQVSLGQLASDQL